MIYFFQRTVDLWFILHANGVLGYVMVCIAVGLHLLPIFNKKNIYLNKMYYFDCTKMIYPRLCFILQGDELKVWYAPQYAKKLKKSLTPDGKTRCK